MRCALVRTLDHFSCDLAQNLQKYSRIMSSRKRDSTSLDDSLTNIQWLCSLDSNPLLDQEEEKTIHSPTETTSMNPYPKPPFSYATLILLAINSTEEKRMTLQDIYKWIEDNFPYYQHCKKAWKNSIRHNLSLHSFFLKAKRPSTLPGKGSYWLISPEGKENIMKEVMKHQQPHVRPNLNAEQSVTKALRPILPKPSDNLLISSHIVNSPSTGNVKLLSDASVTGLPVVILPTHMYMNMANEIAAQAAAGNVAAIGVNPTFLPITTSCSSTDNQNSGDVVKHNGAGQRYGQETESSLAGKATQEVNSQFTSSLSQIAIKNSQEKSLIHSVEQLLFKTESQENEIIFEGCDNSTIVSTSSKSHCQEWESGNNHLNEERNETREMLAPCTKKRKSEKRKSTVHVDEKTSSPNIQKKQNLCQSTPLRPRPQPTLSAINSQANDLMASPGFFFSRHNTSDLADISPVKLMITPTKTCGSHNFLSSLLGSPLTSSNLGCTGLTPLNYASDSGIFTPLKEGEMDFGFLFSPERLGSSKICSTPQRCRKSLGLGLSSTAHNSKALAESQYSSNDADFLKL